MTIARYYDESKHPDGAALPGVPLADIDQDTFDAYPEWLQRSIDALAFYRKSKLSEPSKAQTKAEWAAVKGDSP